MTELVIVRRGSYHDSVTLMLVSRSAAAVDGAQEVAVVMATPVNLELLRSTGFDLAGSAELGPNDLVVAVRADSSEAAQRALAAVEHGLSQPNGGTVSSGLARSAPRSLIAATRQDPELNLALLSVPGRYVTYEAASALQEGLHVFCFSDGVSVVEERMLKREATERGLLFMGPDCGTAIIDGIGIGFANVVDRGPVGIVGASGTGIQEVSCLLDLANVGISQAIGVGGRDLSSEVGGLMFRRGLELLGADAATEVIVAISKPPDACVASAMHEIAASIRKPVVLAFLGLSEHAQPSGAVRYADTLEAAALHAAALVGRPLPTPSPAAVRVGEARFIRGLFSGGTLCGEAMRLVADRVSTVMSNIPLKPDWHLTDIHASERHTFIDFGDDELTEGRPHPMIDPAQRVERIEQEAGDPDVGVILLDLVLGYGAHPDPAGAFAPVIARAREQRPDLAVIAALCGSERDPQGVVAQRARLEAAGAIVTRSVAQAARAALRSIGAEESGR